MLGVNQSDFMSYMSALKTNYRKGIHRMEAILANPTHASEFAANLGGVSVVLGVPVGLPDRNSDKLLELLLGSDVADDAVLTWMHQFYEFTDWDDLCVRLKTREITYSKISRCLCRILLSVSQEMLLAARDNDYTPYARILGFRKSASPLLSVLKKNSSIPLISRPAAAARSLSPEALALYEKDVLAAHLTQTARCAKTGQLPVHEYTRQLILL